MTTRPVDAPSCADPHEPGALNVDEAHARIEASIRPLQASERVPLRDALNRILAADIHSELDIPPDINAAMDGYALRGADLDADGAAELDVVGTAWAGHPLDRAIDHGECARIMTGAPLPAGADTVVMQERCTRDGERVHVRRAEAGANVRAAGEDIARGDLALAAGIRIRPAELGVLASLGLTEVNVVVRPRVTLFASGDELYEPGQVLKSGGLYDSNRYTVWGMLTRLGMIVDDRGHLPDDRSAVEASLAAAAAESDVVITTGGVSVGEADHIGAVLQSAGELVFRQVATKPGRPLHFGRIDRSLFFGLPGNPVSVMITFYQFVQSALLHLAGAPYTRPTVLRARAAAAFGGKSGRTEFQRAVLSTAADGTPEVVPTGAQGSGRLSSMSRANCLVVVPAEGVDIKAGDWVDVQPFDGLV